jgi:RimJ/RimL family protein N-acetyltransferase
MERIFWARPRKEPPEVLCLPEVVLRRYTAADVPLLFEAAYESRGPGFTEWMPWCHQSYTLEESSEYVLSREQAWGQGDEYAFGVFDSATGRYLGGSGINQIQKAHGYGNLGYWIRRSAWGHGYAVAATLATARFAFQELSLVRAEIVIAVGNEKSRRVAEKAGAHPEGVLRNRLRLGGTVYDAHMYSLVPDSSVLFASRKRGVEGDSQERPAWPLPSRP